MGSKSGAICLAAANAVANKEMASDPKDSPEQMLALLASVYGPSEEEARDALVQAAVRKLESTHRQAALAMRHFEHLGATKARGPSEDQSEGRDKRKPRGTQPAKRARPKTDPAPVEEQSPAKAAPSPKKLLAGPSQAPTPPRQAERPPLSIPQRRKVPAKTGIAMELESGVGRDFLVDEHKS